MHMASLSNGLGTLVTTAKNNAQAVAYFPFDLARENYAAAVRMGLVQQSLLASAQFGRSLCVLETLALGPLARTR